MASLAVVYLVSAALVVIAAYATFQRDAERLDSMNQTS